MNDQGSIVFIKDDELYVGTGKLAQKFEVKHRSLTRLVKKYEPDFLEFGEGISAIQLRQFQSEKAGKPFDEYVLNESQAAYLLTLFTNTDKVRKFKKYLTSEFFRQRKILNRIYAAKLKQENDRKNAEWAENRRLGIVERHTQTDMIKKFIEYARSQGSQDPDRYYVNLTKMENSVLFHLKLITIKYKNLRQIVSSLGLAALRMADHIVAKALQDGMDKRMYYKDIFQLAKARIETFADSMGKMEIEPHATKALE